MQKARWLSPIPAGIAILTPAWLEPESGFTSRGVELRAVPSDGGFRLNGVKRQVESGGPSGLVRAEADRSEAVPAERIEF